MNHMTLGRLLTLAKLQALIFEMGGGNPLVIWRIKSDNVGQALTVGDHHDSYYCGSKHHGD